MNTGDQRLQMVQNMHSTNLSKFDYTYNPVGTIATWTQQPDSSTAVVNTMTYDNADQLKSAGQSGGGSATNTYNYDPAGNRLSEVTGTGTAAGQFNNLNQLTGLSSTTTSTTVAGHTSAAITSATINAVPATISNSTNFTANVSLPAGTNVVSIVAQPSSGAATTQRVQIVATGTTATALAYDANGNCTTDENGNNYKWDALNRLTAIIYNSGTYSGTHTEFAYDGLSRRIQIVERAGTTVGSGTVSNTKNYLWIGSEVAEERDASNTVTKRFLPQGEQQSGTSYYYTFDHLGSVREMTDGSGAIVARYDYDPYGRTTLVSGSNLSDKQYAGMYMHQTSGLYLTPIGNTYDPTVGRWIGRDPLGEGSSLNMYSYVSNDPINGIDPLGLTIVPTGTPAYQQQVTQALNDLLKIPGIGPKVQALMDSKNIHNIDQSDDMDPSGHNYPNGSSQDTTSKGSRTPWNPNNNICQEHTSQTESPLARLAHELSHAYDADKGIPKGYPYTTPDNPVGYPAPGEQRAVRSENDVIKAQQGPSGPPNLRTSYGQPMPSPLTD